MMILISEVESVENGMSLPLLSTNVKETDLERFVFEKFPYAARVSILD